MAFLLPAHINFNKPALSSSKLSSHKIVEIMCSHGNVICTSGEVKSIVLLFSSALLYFPFHT